MKKKVPKYGKVVIDSKFKRVKTKTKCILDKGFCLNMRNHIDVYSTIPLMIVTGFDDYGPVQHCIFCGGRIYSTVTSRTIVKGPVKIKFTPKT